MRYQIKLYSDDGLLWSFKIKDHTEDRNIIKKHGFSSREHAGRGAQLWMNEHRPGEWNPKAARAKYAQDGA